MDTAIQLQLREDDIDAAKNAKAKNATADAMKKLFQTTLDNLDSLLVDVKSSRIPAAMVTGPGNSEMPFRLYQKASVVAGRDDEPLPLPDLKTARVENAIGKKSGGLVRSLQSHYN